MLPNRFSLTEKTEERLKREKTKTGVAPNIMARELFFRSIELGPLPETCFEHKPGKMLLDKSTWLGDLERITEEIIKYMYGDIKSDKAAKIWAAHIDKAIALDLKTTFQK